VTSAARDDPPGGVYGVEQEANKLRANATGALFGEH